MAKLSQCTQCPNASVAMPYVGRSSRNRIMVIGMKAKRRSDSLKLPVNSYQRFGKLTNFAGFLENILAYDDEFYYTNVIKCPTVDVRHGIRNCPDWLEAEVRLMKPRLIITLGKRTYLKLTDVFFENFKKEKKVLGQEWGQAIMCTYYNYQIEGFNHITTILPLDIPLDDIRIAMRGGKAEAYKVELAMIRKSMIEIRKLHGWKI